MYQGIAFTDVPPAHPFYNEISKLSAYRITAGCGIGSYCPDAPVTREQMAIFIERAIGVPIPPTPAFQRFADVAPQRGGYAFIEDLARRGITVGCSASPPLYCPDSSVTREQMAIFLIRTLGEFNPPTPDAQRFLDVGPERGGYPFIERMAARGITFGCSGTPPLYCPDAHVTRAQMAAFLVRAFNL